MQLASMKGGGASSSRICSAWVLLVMAMSFDEAKTARAQSTSVVHVGALLDLESPAGKASRTSISLALEDFYGGANGGAASTRVVMHFKDCGQDDVATASAGEKLQRNLSKFVLVNWMLVAWLLEKNYSASLTSMMTVRQLQPAFSDIDELKKNSYYVGYQDGSFVKDLLINRIGFKESRLRNYSSVDQYHEALRNGTWNGGVAAIFDEVPYLKLLLGKSCNEYSMVGRVYKTGGFGFVFPKGSPLVSDVSRAILNVTEGDKMVQIEREWFRDAVDCSGLRSSIDSEMLDFQSFRGVFYITCTLWGIALIIVAAVSFLKMLR